MGWRQSTVNCLWEANPGHWDVGNKKPGICFGIFPVDISGL